MRCDESPAMGVPPEVMTATDMRHLIEWIGRQNTRATCLLSRRT